MYIFICRYCIAKFYLNKSNILDISEVPPRKINVCCLCTLAGDTQVSVGFSII